MQQTARAARHTIHRHQQRPTWDNSVPPAIRVAPGETVVFEDLDSSGGQITPRSIAADLPGLDFSRVNPIAGPVFVEGARPGDALKVTLVEASSPGWGWTAIIPGFGLLAEDFKDPVLHIWRYDSSFRAPALYGPGAKVPLKPFCGTIGLAPAEPGSFSTVPPYPQGGNMDIRDLAPGVELYLPVKVEGALFSVGDAHAAQGDGEVCGTAIESPLTVAIRFELVKDANLKFPRFVTPGPVSRHLDEGGYFVTTGIGPDLMGAAKDAVRGMIDLVVKERGLAPEHAYMLCSVCADLRISEIVDQPNWVVSCYMPRLVFA
ncbi:MAG: acetamidase/formamidase family protein [Rhodospirillaceae bacterium]|nr:acetamidase/formamidase family protein [Rhodospirillaceae bacterium]